MTLLGAMALCALVPLLNEGNAGPEVAAAQDAPQSFGAGPRTAAGQSATRLSDGRWLLIGGRVRGAASGAVSVQASATSGNAPTSLPALTLKYPRAGHTATVLADGTVAVIGGVAADGRPVAQLEILDLARAETRVIVEPGLIVRANHSATLLTDGRVLLVGGESSAHTLRSDAQLWSPETGTSEAVSGALTTARAGHQAVLLPDGSVLISGGRNANGATLGGADRFDPGAARMVALSPAEEVTLRQLNGDAHAPGVDAVIPAADATGAAVDTRIAIRLGRAVDPAAVSDGSVTVVGPAGAIEGQLVVAEGGRLLFFTPSADLLPASTYTVFVRVSTASAAFPMTMSTFTTQALQSETAAGIAPNSRSGTFSLEGSRRNPLAQNDTVASSKKSASTDKRKQKDKPAEKPVADEEDDEVEDWLPGPEHRHGNWRVLGLRREPHTNRPVVAPPHLAAAARATALFGRVVRLNGRPIANVPVRVGAVSTQTDAQGRFLLSGLPAGRQMLFVDGARAQNGGRAYLSHYLHVEIAKGKTTRLPEPIYLAREDRANAVSFPSPTDREVVVTNPAIPGLELHIPKGAVLRTPDGKIVTKLSITPLPLNRAPFPVPMAFPVYFAVQPAGTFVDNSGSPEVRGIRVLYPNYADAPPGTRVVFWNYDANGEGWQVYGHGTVSEDGTKVVPDEGVTQATLMAFGYGLETHGKDPATAPPVNGCVRGGDPVDCASGLFLHRSVDLVVTDTIPLILSRTYRQNDPVSRDFGIGSNHSFAMFLNNPTSEEATPAMVDLILPDGGRVRFNKISGTSVNDVVFEHTTTPSIFQGARLQISTITHAWEMTLADKSVLIFQPHTPNQLVGIRDRYGSTLTITRVGDLISQISSPHGRTMAFAYDTSRRITQVTDNAGRSVRYQYDSAGRLWKATDANGKIEQYGYDSANRMTTVTDRRGNAMVTNVYDANGRVQQQTLADGAVWQFAYVLDAYGKVSQTDVTDPRGYIRRDVFNAAGYLTQEILALGQPEERTTLYGRESVSNRVTSITDFLGRVTKVGYDFKGNLTSVTRLFGTANAVTESATFDLGFSVPLSYSDELSHQSQLTYDSLGNLVAVTDPLGHSVSASYDSEGRVLSVSNALGKTTQLSYEGGDLASVTDPLGQTVSFFTDQLGRTTGFSDPAGRNGRVAYDVLDRVTESTDALGQKNTATYDENGNLKTFTDPRNLAAHTFSYDGRNRVHTYTDPLGSIETFEYDGLGNLISRTDRKSQQTTFQYDALNRLKKVTYADASMVTLTWDDANRRLITVDSVNGTITRTYDDLGRLTQESGPEGQVDYQYDAAGRRSQMSVAGIATPVTYQFDAANRLTQVAQGTVAVSFGYDAADRRTSTTLPNGIVATRTLDDADQLTGIAYDKGATHIGDLAYSYDNAGRRTGMSGSLAKLLVPSSVTSTNYDAANRLVSWSGTTLSYDGNGNLSGLGTTSYSWNARDELTATSEQSSSFSYDAMGRRRSRTISSTATGYLHDGVNPLKVAGDIMLSGTGLDELHTQISGSAQSSRLTDALGSTLALTDASGAIAASYSYGPYGQVAKSGTADTSFQFTARERDLPTLQFSRGRYYNAELSRFISEDPLGLGGGANVYAYLGGDPISFTDPLGLYSWDEFIDDAANYSSGFGDSFTFGLTGYIRDQFDIGSVDKCSRAYHAGEATDIAFETGTMGLSAGLKALAKNASRRAARKAATPFIEAFRGAGQYEGGMIHHANPLFGHPGGLPTTFPTGGLPAWIHSGTWNLRYVADQAAHNAAHQSLRRMEGVWGGLVNPATTGVRAARDLAAASCGCD